MRAGARGAVDGRRRRLRRLDRPDRSDRGGIAIEAAIVVPGVIGLVLLAIAAGRVQTAAGTVEAAARAGARTGSLQRSVAGVDKPARESALATLHQQGVTCRHEDVRVTTDELTLDDGPVVTVRVTVDCDVELADLLGGPSGLPVTKHLSGEFISVMDRYRGT
ncbi:TadE/TadG family type IV pilus assembly protein [Kitasatospora aureofaciens]|uniref:TadE/TadG family type IV pilus assembly protein n=1 Tax=Kitasatospora aureofaciens TaxID=1894 RepID=UPI000689E371|nr:TadE/TadG family type IV pilus assembly protein [Kitasatospora aureofaciens]